MEHFITGAMIKASLFSMIKVTKHFLGGYRNFYLIVCQRWNILWAHLHKWHTRIVKMYHYHMLLKYRLNNKAPEYIIIFLVHVFVSLLCIFSTISRKKLDSSRYFPLTKLPGSTSFWLSHPLKCAEFLMLWKHLRNIHFLKVFLHNSVNIYI